MPLWDNISRSIKKTTTEVWWSWKIVNKIVFGADFNRCSRSFSFNFSFFSMCSILQPQKQTDLQTHNEWITFISFHLLWMQHTHTCMHTSAAILLSLKWIATFAISTYTPRLSNSPYFIKSVCFFPLYIFLFKRRISSSIKLLNSLVVCLVGRLDDLPSYIFVFHCNIYTDFISQKYKSNYFAKIFHSFHPELNRFDYIH